MRFRSGFNRLARVLLAALAVLLIVEIGLRLMHVGFDPDFFLDRNDGYTVINHRFGRLFYPEELVRGAYPARFRTVKEAGTLRIFVLGESAAAGYPDPAFSASRVLAERLARLCPEKTFEVINTGVTALNSHAIRIIAHEVAGYQPDAVIVYMGNNEVVGPFGPGSVLGGAAPPSEVARFLVAFRSTRTGQLLQSIADAVTSAGRPPAWAGMEMFESAKVAPDSKALQVVYRNFARNLKDLVEELTAHGTPVILCTVASNLTECPPLAPDDAGGQSDSVEVYNRGVEAARRGEMAEALALLRFARDTDALRFRADQTINNTIRDIAASHGCLLVEAEETFARAQSEDLSGNEPLFYEHVHFTFSGNVLMSTLWSQALASVLSHLAPCLAAFQPLSGDETASLAESLGYSALARGYSIGTILGMLERPPFSVQQTHTERLSYWRSELSEVEDQLTPDYIAKSISRLEDAMKRKPEDGSIAYWLGRHYEDRGEMAAATASYLKSLDYLPDNPATWLQLGDVYRRQGFYAQAKKAYKEVSRIFPANPLSRDRLRSLQGSVP